MAVLMIMSVAFVFASCSSKKYKDTDATLPSSTVQNETVTNSNGETVHATQSATQSANQNSNSNGKDSKTTTKKANPAAQATVYSRTGAEYSRFCTSQPRGPAQRASNSSGGTPYSIPSRSSDTVMPSAGAILNRTLSVKFAVPSSIRSR